MIIPERMMTFINALDDGLSPFLENLAKEALEADVPIIRRDMQSLLKVLITMKQPHRILEIGTAVGFSAILMAEYAPDDCKITTIEQYEKRIPLAKDNFRRAGYQDKIELLEGDAAVIMPQLDDLCDFIFMDAAKGQYPALLDDCLRLLVPGGVLVSDNVLQDGDLIESHYIVERRNRTIYKRMRSYLYTLKHHPQLTTAILPVGDGVTLSVKL
ncbi:MAG: O-methyltransferase [Eubacterium sp.]|nr:O-methyltransferase [Eubacterium sp.]